MSGIPACHSCLEPESRIRMDSCFRRNDKNEAGFTLLELLVSISLLLLMVLILTGALQAGHRSVAAGERRMDFLEKLRVTHSALQEQLQGRIPLSVEEEGGGQKPAFSGTEESLRLASTVSLLGSQNGCVLVTYRVETDRNGRKALYAKERNFFAENEREIKLLENFTDIGFSYETAGLTEAESGWSTSWNEGQEPRKIMLRLEDGTKEYTSVFHMKVSSTVASAGAAGSAVRGLPRSSGTVPSPAPGVSGGRTIR